MKRIIYVLKSAMFKENSNGDLTYGILLKIGSTNEKNRNLRMKAYKLHNPSSKVLFEILGCTEDHETRIHALFNHLRYSDYGKEWFVYDRQIIEYFETVTGPDDFDKLSKTVPQVSRFNGEVYRVVVNIKEAKYSLGILYVPGPYIDSLVNDVLDEGFESIDEVWNFIEEREGSLVVGAAKEKYETSEANNVREMVHNSFSIGDSIPYGLITQRLRYCYAACGIIRIPNWRDLKDYFELEEIKLKGSKKGYKIINRLNP